MKLITPAAKKKAGLISRRSLLVAAPAVILSSKLGDAQGCGGGFCYPPSAASTCMAPFYRDWSTYTQPVSLFDPTVSGFDAANAFEVRAENSVGGVTFAFTEDYNTTGAVTGAIGIWTSTNGILGPWSFAGNAIVTGGGGTWDQYNPTNPSCIYNPTAGLWYLYYSASNGSNQYSIGLATSSTPTVAGSWTKYSGNPIISGSNNADPEVLIHPSGSGYIMYSCGNYPSTNGDYWYYTSSDGITWTFGGQFLPAAVPGDPDYKVEYMIEPTVWKNKYCFYEALFDIDDEIYALGQGSGIQLYAISADGFNFTRYPVLVPTQIFGGGQTSIVQQNGLLYIFTNMFPDFSNFNVLGSGMTIMVDTP
jgi:hypothetical protein